MTRDFDIVVVGSGFAGSLIAMIARRLGRSVALIERGQHSRFAIGESSTPLANLLLEELARRYDLPRLLPLTKWGSWQCEHPELACGLKRGFTFCHHALDAPFAVDAERHRHLLVAASPRDEIADTHWFRADFDAFFVREAIAAGVAYFDQTCIGQVIEEPDAMTLSGRHGDGREFCARAKFVIDATGPRGLLHRAFGLGERPFPNYPATEALFTHFRGVKRFSEIQPTEGEPPYPIDDAAMHHVFPGGWIWVVRFNNGITSAGAALEPELATELRLSEGWAAWLRLLDRLPSVRAQFADATECFPFIHQPQVAFRSTRSAGASWALLPSAAGFVDPLLSTGFPLTLLGVTRLAQVIANDWGQPKFAKRLQEYASTTDAELAITAELIGALYRQMSDPPVFNALTQLYFAAASYAESARRLGRAELASGFLLHSHPEFGAALRRCLAMAHDQIGDAWRTAFMDEIARVIAPINVAGLANPIRRNWYSARAEDLLAAAGKLQSSPAEIQRMLLASGFYPEPAAN